MNPVVQSSGRRRWDRAPWGWAVAVLGVVLIAGGLAIWYFRHPLLPVPTPSNLGSMDPQVRAELVQVVRKVAASPFDPSLRSELGLAFAVNGLWVEARTCFQDAIRLGATGPMPPMYAAVALQELGESAGAVSELRAVVRRFPECAPAWHRFGTALIAEGDPEGAQEAFTVVTRLAPAEWRGWAGLGEARLRGAAVGTGRRVAGSGAGVGAGAGAGVGGEVEVGTGDAALAVEALERAVRLEPFARSARHLLAQAYQAAGRAEDAAREFAAGRSESLGPMPDEWSVRALSHMKSLPDLFERSDALLAAGRVDDALAVLRTALEFRPTNVALICRYARMLNAAGQARVARELLAPALAGQRDDLTLAIAASETAAALEDLDEALVQARRAVALAPRSAEAHVAESNALLAAHRDEEAVAALERALEIAPENVGLHVQLGDILWLNLKRPAQALTAYARAQAVDPIHPMAFERWAQVQLDRGDHAAAGEAIERLRRLVGDSSVVQELERQTRKAGGERSHPDSEDTSSR